MRFEIYTAKELVDKYPSNGEPPHLCPNIGIMKGKARSLWMRDSLCDLQEMAHDLRLWGQSQKSRAEKAEADKKDLNDKLCMVWRIADSYPKDNAILSVLKDFEKPKKKGSSPIAEKMKDYRATMEKLEAQVKELNAFLNHCDEEQILISGLAWKQAFRKWKGEL